MGGEDESDGCGDNAEGEGKGFGAVIEKFVDFNAPSVENRPARR